VNIIQQCGSGKRKKIIADYRVAEKWVKRKSKLYDIHILFLHNEKKEISFTMEQHNLKM